MPWSATRGPDARDAHLPIFLKTIWNEKPVSGLAQKGTKPGVCGKPERNARRKREPDRLAKAARPARIERGLAVRAARQAQGILCDSAAKSIELKKY